MTSTKLLCLVGPTVAMLSALPGCATFEQCGSPGCVDDVQITTEIRALFDQHPALEGTNALRIQTRDHIVYLYGLVDTGLEQSLAKDIALKAPGVARVVSSIEVRNVGW
jgi:osmotically-inducible protein OsmY